MTIDHFAMRSCLPIIPQEQSRSLNILHHEIMQCTKCVEAGFLERSSPRCWGVAPAPFMVIGQAPGIREQGPGGEMYLGPAGQKLRSWLRQAGFEDSDFGTKVYMTAITKCFPGRNEGSSKDRAPSRAEQILCRPWLDEQFAIVQPKLVVLFGKMAIGAFLNRNLPLEECVGRAYKRHGLIYLPLPHSSGASTWLNDPAHHAILANAIELLQKLRNAITQEIPIDEELIANYES